MIEEHASRARHVALAVRGLDRAHVVLEELLHDRCQFEARRAALGKIDPLQTLTGRSALDRAIASTREIIERMDALVAELHDEGHAGSTAPAPLKAALTPGRPTAAVPAHRGVPLAARAPLPTTVPTTV